MQNLNWQKNWQYKSWLQYSCPRKVLTLSLDRKPCLVVLERVTRNSKIRQVYTLFQAQSNSKLDDLCLRQTRSQWWNLKYSNNFGQNLEDLPPNLTLNSKNRRKLNSICVRTQSFEAWWNSNSMKSELVEALLFVTC